MINIQSDKDRQRRLSTLITQERLFVQEMCVNYAAHIFKVALVGEKCIPILVQIL